MPKDIYSQELTKNQSKWKKHYDKLCLRGKLRASSREEAKLLLKNVEEHHIIPKCLNGTDNKENLVFLSTREHFIAHQLLVKIYPKNSGLTLACKIMCMDRYGTRIGNRMYSWLKKLEAEELRKLKIGKTKENDNGRKITSEKLKGRTKETHEYLALIGENTTNCLKGRTKEKFQYLQERSEKLYGRTKENHSGVRMVAEKLTKLNLDQQILVQTLKSQGLENDLILNYFLIEYGISFSNRTLYRILKRNLKGTVNNISSNNNANFAFN